MGTFARSQLSFPILVPKTVSADNTNASRYAAIDFGSTSTRAYLTTVDTKTKQTKGYRVQKTGVDDDKKKRFLRGEWPSKGCPFDAPYPVGYDAAGKEHADKRDRSLKSFVWFLADDDDQHPYTRDLKDYHDSLTGGVQEKQKFRKRLMNMLVCHLSIVADQIRQEAVLRQTAIRRLVLCVPNAWDKPNFQKVLRPIMDNVARGIETYCVFESEALSQFILHQHSYLLKDHDYVLVCDFGGHFMLSTKIPPEWRMTHTAQDMLCTLARLLRLTLHFQGGSLFQFCREGPEDDHPAFFSLPQGNFGVRGGSQLWEDHVRPIIDEHLKTLGLAPERTSILRAKFLDGFYMKKSEVDQSVRVGFAWPCCPRSGGTNSADSDLSSTRRGCQCVWLSRSQMHFPMTPNSIRCTSSRVICTRHGSAASGSLSIWLSRRFDSYQCLPEIRQ